MTIFLTILCVLVYLALGAVIAGLEIRFCDVCIDDVEIIIPTILFWPIVIPILLIVKMCEIIIEIIAY